MHAVVFYVYTYSDRFMRFVSAAAATWRSGCHVHVLHEQGTRFA
jgi:hypothetical protein